MRRLGQPYEKIHSQEPKKQNIGGGVGSWDCKLLRASETDPTEGRENRGADQW